MELLHRYFVEWGRAGGRLRARRLLKAKLRKRQKVTPPKVKKPRGMNPLTDPRNPFHQRNLKMVEMYRGNNTLESVGAKFGITRERVRQILEKMGVTVADNGRKKIILGAKISESARREKNRQERDERRYAKWLDCSKDVYIQLTGCVFSGWDIRRGNTPAAIYGRQKWSAGIRRIEWKLTFPEWWRIWQASGKWELRGRGQGKWVMSRYGDTGPYSVDNVVIIPAVENNSDRAGKKSGLPMGVSKRLNRFRANKMIDGKKIHIGTFNSPEEAHAAYRRFDGKKKP